MADPYDYNGRDGRGNDKLWHEEDEDMDEECVSYDDRDELDKPYWTADNEDESEYDDVWTGDDVELTDEQQRVLDEDLDYDDQFELED
jgi:hypothetical protein